MFTTTMIVLMGLAAVACFIVATTAQRNSSDLRRPVALVMGGILAVLALVVTGFASTYTQNVGEAKVLRSFGTIVDVDLTEGVGFKAPWVTTIDYDIRNQAVSYVGDGSATVKNSKGEQVPVTGPAIVAQTKDGAAASMDLVILYSIVPAKDNIRQIQEEYGGQDNFEAKLVQNAAKSLTRNVPLKYSTASFRLERSDAAMEMMAVLNARLEPAGVTVEAVDLQDIRYSQKVEESLENVQEATNRVNTARAELETARINADKTRVEAQAAADYDQIVRCGATTTTVPETVDGIETKVIKVTPRSNEECENRLNDQVLANKYIDALKEMGADGNLIVVPQGFNGILNVPAKAPQVPVE